MKQFLKMFLAVLCALLVVGIFKLLMFFGVIGSLMSEETIYNPEEFALTIDLSEFQLGERTSEGSLNDVLQTGAAMQTVGLWDLTQAIGCAATDPSVKFIFLKPDSGTAGVSDLEELRKALLEFRESGKPVIAYTENPTSGSYYLASAADKVYMTSCHGGNPMVMGVSGQLIFLKDILDKFGVNVQLIRHGKYKSAGEMFVKNEASPENLEQNQVMVDGIWDAMANSIAESRNITKADLDSLINNLALLFPEDFLRNGLVDGLLTKEELKKELATLSYKESFDDVNLFSAVSYVNNMVSYEDLGNLSFDNIGNKIAIIYADGEIIDGIEEPGYVTGDHLAGEIAKVRADSSVKAVVFRVNSPGGSVVASEKIRNEIDLLQADKPVVASYGNYAASGGYWISSGCNYVFSDATTLTGSIGVFGMIPDLSKTLKDVVHINITPVNSNKHGDMFSLMRPFTKEESDYMQASIEDIYTRFTNLVASGRNKSVEYVDSIAQGRVWTGTDGLRLGLVDEIGTLEDAVCYAAMLASESHTSDLSEWTVCQYPAVPTLMETILSMIDNTTQPAYVLQNTAFEPFGKMMQKWQKTWLDGGRADIWFARMPYGLQLN